MNKRLLVVLGLAVIGGLSACKSTSLNKASSAAKKTDFAALAVKNFDVNRYAGKWYEVARFDFFWEKDMKNVTAEYTLEDDGSIEVINSGFNTTKNKHKQSTGTAKPANDASVGALQVSFFGPFYSEYNVVKIDPDYRYALVFGENTDYVWILSRDKTVPDEVKQEYLAFARQHGYDLNRLVWTQQD